MIIGISILAVAYVSITSATSIFEPEQSINTLKSVHANKQLRIAKVPRKLENSEKKVDISNYSIIYEKCENADTVFGDQGTEGNSTVVSLEPLVKFRLCPSGFDSCDDQEHKMNMDEYLTISVKYKQKEQDNYCMVCEAKCTEGDTSRRHLELQYSQQSNIYCDSCVDDCEKIEEMEDNGYIDAKNFIECLQIVADENPLYAGPVCAGHQGSKIKIGVFIDADCMSLDTSKDVEDYLGDSDGNSFKLSHALLKQTYNKSAPIICEQVDEEDKEVCTNLNDAANRYAKRHPN
mmetsp:Transcript_19894/g.23768  ORF Transcript_19894/g.23768 Transcript_19894/m.23768 type:complete len:291 (-) Transcript_19894:174-1046(-)|eukprot:CAMPEP_0198250908 /NCGR_PEP_ID=MMETSP1447-20131203/1919_1 /TAXON_ID=420782 /ORGANISM="Chaetoceros dichaeta, Strain CCMP1751" /LENGTH=290 /DNA_ID=CAMNT_0043935815 /DNA_START=70 /DNA_END=942 /DNA_ORIENTATION=+